MSSQLQTLCIIANTMYYVYQQEKSSFSNAAIYPLGRYHCDYDEKQQVFKRDWHIDTAIVWYASAHVGKNTEAAVGIQTLKRARKLEWSGETFRHLTPKKSVCVIIKLKKLQETERPALKTPFSFSRNIGTPKSSPLHQISPKICSTLGWFKQRLLLSLHSVQSLHQLKVGNQEEYFHLEIYCWQNQGEVRDISAYKKNIESNFGVGDEKRDISAYKKNIESNFGVGDEKRALAA